MAGDSARPGSGAVASCPNILAAMAETAARLVAEAGEALGRGEVQQAVELLERSLALEDLADTRELLGALAYADDRMDVVCRHWEAAFRAYRASGHQRQAARIATRLSEVHWSILGNPAAGRGWLQRARRLLDEIGPCVEWGYFELALIACDRPDADELLASAERARQTAVEHGDAGLEVRALADGGLALITQGRIHEGFRQLDEALAALGEVDDEYLAGTTLCALLSSCDRAGDSARAAELVQLIHELVLGPNGGRPVILGTHCNVAYGGVLCATGRWPEAEEAILSALGPGASVSAIHRVDAASRLAEIRVYQGRIDEAAELLAPHVDHVTAGGSLALVHIARGERALARAVLRRTVTRLIGDIARGAPLLALLVECEIALDELDAARDASRLLEAMDEAAEMPFVAALTHQARGRLALAAGDLDDAVTELCRAREHLMAAGRPLIDVTVHLDLADAHAAVGDMAAAVDAAQGAYAAAVRLGAGALRDRAAASLRVLGAPVPRAAQPVDALAGLTARELDVLDGIRRGETNAAIAAQLFVSAKTVEHHVSRVLAKLGVRSRAEAAAVASAAAVTGGQTSGGQT